VVTDENAVEDWSQSPPVRKTLERWGLLEAGSPRSALQDKLAMDIAKVKVRRKDPIKAILDDVRISLKRVLLPVAGKPSAVDAVNYAARVAVASHESPVAGPSRVSVLHLAQGPA